MKIRKAIIPAAGLGTRFLPATKAMPKEMLPIVDKPTIQYIVEEAVASGIEDIIIVTGKGKRAIEDHFDHSYELEQNLTANHKWDLLEEVNKSTRLADIHYIRQKQPQGLGHAIWCARKFIGDEPFAVLLGDDIIEADVPCLKQMIDIYDKGTEAASIVGVQEVPWEEVDKYGIIAGTTLSDRLFQVEQMIEKPKRTQSPSNLAIMGRYILTPQIFDILEEQQVGVNGEIQLTDAISKLSLQQSVLAYQFQGNRFDVGDKLGFIKTTIHYGLQNPTIRSGLISYMGQLLSKLPNESK